MGAIGVAVGIILFLVLVGAIFWGGQQILSALSPYIAEPFMTIIRVVGVILLIIVAVLVLIALLDMVGIHVRMPSFR